MYESYFLDSKQGWLQYHEYSQHDDKALDRMSYHLLALGIYATLS